MQTTLWGLIKALDHFDYRSTLTEIVEISVKGHSDQIT
uniref:Uncharacterized protein n=1 Tax=Schistosoma haematobium TaxID=6185 RepID=A0A095BY80_SCHHA